MVKLIWLIATISAQGNVRGTMPETKQFPSMEACAAYAQIMVPRVQDYVRGIVQGDWDHPVEVKHECDPGQQA